MAKRILERLSHAFGDAVLNTDSALGNESATVLPTRLLEIATFLRDERDLAMAMPIDCTAVDYFGVREVRFDVVWHLYSPEHGHRLRLRVACAEDALEVPSLTPLWPGMDWHEREAYDLYGVRFSGHPNLCRILMYEEFVGHPLRRDYPIDRRQPLIPLLRVRDVPTQRHPPREMLNRP